MVPAALLLIISFFFLLELIVFIVSSLLLYTSCLFSMLPNKDTVDNEIPDGICSLDFVVDEFSGLFLHLLIFSNIHSGSVYIINQIFDID